MARPVLNLAEKLVPEGAPRSPLSRARQPDVSKGGDNTYCPDRHIGQRGGVSEAVSGRRASTTGRFWPLPAGTARCACLAPFCTKSLDCYEPICGLRNTGHLSTQGERRNCRWTKYSAPPTAPFSSWKLVRGRTTSEEVGPPCFEPPGLPFRGEQSERASDPFRQG